MRSVLLSLVAVAASAVASPSPVAAQQERIWRPSGGDVEADIILYRATNYGGPSIRAQTPVPDLGINWPIRSLRVVRGEWQLCTGVNYRGRCATVRESTPVASAIANLGIIRSARPPATPLPGEITVGRSLRGMSAEFFTMPSSDGRRVLACPSGTAGNAACARRSAERFCRGRGYDHVGNVAQQTVSGRVYLADVLCKRNAG
jgi:hypothetical protein